MAAPRLDITATTINMITCNESSTYTDDGYYLIPRKTFTTSTGTMTSVTATNMAHNDYVGDYTNSYQFTVTYSDGSTCVRNYKVYVYSPYTIIGDFPGTFTHTGTYTPSTPAPVRTVYHLYSYTENGVTLTDIQMYYDWNYYV